MKYTQRFSKHGSTCDTGDEVKQTQTHVLKKNDLVRCLLISYQQQQAFPKVPIEVKQAYWAQIEQTFDGILFNTQESRINETSIADMISRNHRAVVFMSDYVEFTKSSKFAFDACLIDNQLGPGLTEEPDALAWENKVNEWINK